MLESIVLLWLAFSLDAPLWVYAIVFLMLLSSTLTFVTDVIDKVQKRQIERLKQKQDELLERYSGNKQKEDE